MENKKSLLEQAVALWKEQSQMHIPMHAAGAGYFIVLSVFPLLTLLLGLLRYTGLSVNTLTDFLAGVLPKAMLPGAKKLILGAYRNTSGTVISLSLLVALWSASRGVYGLMQGLNRVYYRTESRSWIRVRILSVGYTGVFLAVILATLILSVFGNTLLKYLPASGIFAVLDKGIGLRFALLLVVQSVLFCGMFMALPSGGNGFFASLPGALLASLGWLIFSNLYSWYMTHFTGYANVFGSVYAVALSMLWLYVCLRILFFGGGWNARKK